MATVPQKLGFEHLLTGWQLPTATVSCKTVCQVHMSTPLSPSLGTLISFRAPERKGGEGQIGLEGRVDKSDPVTFDHHTAGKEGDGQPLCFHVVLYLPALVCLVPAQRLPGSQGTVIAGREHLISQQGSGGILLSDQNVHKSNSKCFLHDSL
jgi:hypothetical protein